MSSLDASGEGYDGAVLGSRVAEGSSGGVRGAREGSRRRNSEPVERWLRTRVF